MNRFSQFFLLIFLLSFLNSCNQKPNSVVLNSKDLFAQKCALCHVAPTVDVLPKHLWAKFFPELGAKMGVLEPGYNPLKGMNINEIDAVIESEYYTRNQIVTREQWEQLKEYIIQNAPDKIDNYQRSEHQFYNLDAFTPKKINLDNSPGTFITFLSFQNDVLYYADLFGGFYTYNFKLNQSTEYKRFENAIVWYQKLKNGNEIFTEIGKLDPTEQKLGKLWIQRENQEKELIAKELHRPVHTLSQDLNKDGSIEHIISEFGHLTGSISKINSDSTSELLWPNPGAIQTQMHDVNNDGMMDLVSLVAQGDEAIVSFIQQKNGDFKPEYLMRYQPNYGSSWFEMMDFDGDGDLDLITANGDNADLTYTQKPYHGMRISLNDGYGNFQEAFFYQLNGATRLVAEDFDQDNDIDIALVSTFPDYENHPEMAFIYLENLGDFKFKENIIEDVNFGRWFLLDKGDIDKDGDIDILISSFTYTFSPVPDEFQKIWEENEVDLILLKNNLFK
jgi:predicted nucleotidyltransferase